MDRQQYIQKRKLKVIKEMEKVIESIRKDELVAITSSLWAEDGHFIFRVDLVENKQVPTNVEQF